ncbi:Trafficking protein particle complex subunit 2 [Tetrabaena socialis]|uniref:Trafficking protein particle complex subunit 2 n=1 Tax=Tetrabaena socialis TaxID=47790 RepID=A0A2J8AC18_9CHLO|nr:Trafficking protein particle complex subunit 2 [Tetrabaena socialis]|eukprot:PNH10033.1 Trafficking protein particle complex subunit 2 [Tetrabaena socialis]
MQQQQRSLACAHFGSCSGCSLQHGLAAPPLYDEAVRFFRGLGLEHVPAVMKAAHGWRCRAKLAVRGPAGHPEVGLFRQGSHTVVDIQQTQYLHQFVLHSALDSVDEQMWLTKEAHLKVVDRFNGLNVTAFVTAGNTRFLMLHDGRSDDALRAFFTEVYELYLRSFGQKSPRGYSEAVLQ